ncbi:MAG: hypothetical protein LUQ41_00485 [Methanomicrobiales archaeon]|nr:hypothetical protein [Methanomicrobiales archaeon]
MVAMLRSFLVFVLILSILVAGCAGNQEAVTVRTGEVFTIGIGQSARIAGEDMVITFEEVIGDSRCPREVVCVWAGVAASRVRIIHLGTPSSLVLNQPGLSEDAQETFGDYTLTFNLNPYPRAGEEIPPDEYRLTLSITR